MPNFDDVSHTPHYRPQLDYPVSVIQNLTVLLKDGETTATIYPITSPDELPQGLLSFLCEEFNMEIEKGETFPFFDTLMLEAFQNYWFGSFAAVMVLGSAPQLDRPRQWEKECLGTFFVKPNYPGRCSHICNAGFLVNAGIRGKGIGTTLAECYLEWAPRLGYTYSVFNLVFETNIASRRIWENLHFRRIGRIKAAGILKGHDDAVDALMYGRELVPDNDTDVGTYRFDKIKYYLETGKYPPMADRQEKSRLRSSASHYRLQDGKLLLKGKEVISDPRRQLEICTEIHLQGHIGINKTTSTASEKYHWTRIKDTASLAIRNCTECRDPAKVSVSMKGRSLPAIKKAHILQENLLRSPRKMQRTDDGVTSRGPQDVQAMVAVAAAAQLHNLPSNQMDRQHSHDNVDTSILTGELGLDDPGIMAAVEMVERHSNNQHHTQQYGGHNNAEQQYTNYQQYSAQQHPHDNGSRHHHHHHRRNSDQSDIPVDPQVANAFDDEHGGSEMEIARALIQANENNDGDTNDNSNIFQ
ncbi:unnamed protein product [Kuraishia capsulata CBS 1993]|uniref:N-acetyltransferase domain-containing protein n=1 Tax=Kuraishia capsulata CBS 1993 TaxID=1382522 RepID=W6ML70_9ASCO|nr:uncharacterized protein KUCA_T00001482001 [Kuraishia capsulata CBS 1993]CDK25512.1 unnamed protein product [Kuraishia capsulata CBS 1993]